MNDSFNRVNDALGYMNGFCHVPFFPYPDTYPGRTEAFIKIGSYLPGKKDRWQ